MYYLSANLKLISIQKQNQSIKENKKRYVNIHPDYTTYFLYLKLVWSIKNDPWRRVRYSRSKNYEKMFEKTVKSI